MPPVHDRWFLTNHFGGEKMAELLKPLGDFLYSVVPPAGWAVVHLVTAVVGFYFAYKVKYNAKLAWGFVLYAIGGLLYTTVHLGLGLIDNGTTHLVESVLVFVAVILFGMGFAKK